MLKINCYKKACVFFLAGAITISGFLYNGQVLATDERENREQLLIELDEGSTEQEIEEIRHYVSNKVEPGTFASLYIDREEHTSGVLVLSFTNELAADMKKEILALTEDPAKVEFRVVKYTEEQLRKKQQEVDTAVFDNEVFKDEGITVHHTSPNIINDKVEVGISPFNDNTTQLILDHFEDEMVTVVEGKPLQLLTAQDSEPVIGDGNTDLPQNIKEEEPQPGIFTRVWNWLAGLLK